MPLHNHTRGRKLEPRRLVAMRRVFALFLTFGAPLPWSLEAPAQQCPPPDPARSHLERIADCLHQPSCDRQIGQENLDDKDCVGSIYKWDQDPQGKFVAIRDIKMCQVRRKVHDPHFVHGLLMPFEHVCGIEDNKLYDDSFAYLRSMWKVGWEIALNKLPEEEIALVVNPPTIRSEDHLHIHIVRRNGLALPPTWVRPLDNLDDVWRQALSFARGKGIMDNNYGILVCKSAGQFRLLVEAGRPVNQQNPEKKYTQYED